MNTGEGGYKLTEYDSEGRWLRDLYMNTPDKNTATKVLQVNMNGIGGSSNGYAGPYNVGMTLDGQIYGDRIVSGSISAEKLDVSYTSQVESKISAAESNAISDTNQKLKNYYTISEINSKLSVTDRKIEASVETVNQSLLEKNGNYYGSYTPSLSNAPASSWNYSSLREAHCGDFFYNTTNGYAYRFTARRQCLQITFSADSRTESPNYDWVQIFYESGGVIYALPKLGGTIGSTTVYDPAASFWVYWRTDSSVHDYYSFAITSVSASSTYQEVNDTVTSLPTDAGTAEILSGTNYPQSEHSPYSDNVRKLWKYEFSGSISTSLSYSWERVKDSDITAAKTAADNAISRITVAENSISTMVKKGDFGTYMQQNYNSFLLGFNNNSGYVKITENEIGLYNGAINDSRKRTVFNHEGLHFYRDNYYVGKVGTNQYTYNAAQKGLVIDLDSDGKYIALARRQTPTSTTFDSALTYARAGAMGYANEGLYLGCNMDCSGWKLHNMSWDDGSGGATYGVTATMNFVQVKEVSGGGIDAWYSRGQMVFQNGILTYLRHSD